MSDERHTFETTRVRLDEILVQVRKKDTSLEQGLELLEEGVRLANLCNELIDQTSWRPADAGTEGEGVAVDGEAEEPAEAETSDEVPLEDDERD